MDMIGDADLNIEARNKLNSLVARSRPTSRARSGYQSHFFARTAAIEDDHIYLLQN